MSYPSQNQQGQSPSYPYSQSQSSHGAGYPGLSSNSSFHVFNTNSPAGHSSGGHTGGTSAPAGQNLYGQMDSRQAAAYYHTSGAPPNTIPPGMYQQPGYPQQVYISPPPPAAPGQFPNPNPSPFTTAPRTASTSPPQPVRFPCSHCSATFTRQHDRKRHHETLHLEHPPVYRCQYCGKEFARGDSLKRHVDGGCDKMPASSAR